MVTPRCGAAGAGNPRQPISLLFHCGLVPKRRVRTWSSRHRNTSRRPTRHTSFYLSCGADDAPLIVFVHGWPELSHSWRHQLRCFADLGFRAVAPDMRGYGRSTVHPAFEAYTMEAIVGDMIELLDALGRESAVWVGHDWGARSSGASCSTTRHGSTASRTCACRTCRTASRCRR
jgi:alpha-beta hydrolase superfamily lysophospholipase